MGLRVFITALFLMICSHLSSFGVGNEYTLVKPRAGMSGDNQHETAGRSLENPIKIQVLKDGVPQSGIAVQFSFVEFPLNSKGFSLSDTLVVTDNNGYASAIVTLGDKEGDYRVSVRAENSIEVFSMHARKPDWLLMMSIGLLGGLGIFLFGMFMMSEGLQKAVGNKMRSILSSVTNNRFVAVGVGAFVTTVIQSSTATSVMLVSFVHSGLMRFSQTIGLILGAAIGSTITVQLIAFNFSAYSLIFVVIGFCMRFFAGRENLRNIGQAVLGFGLLFYGMFVMSQSLTPLKFYEPFIEFIVRLENPLIGVAVGAIITALIHSSAAFIGIMIILASQGLLSIEAGIGMVLGANLGTPATAILAGLKSNRESKKVGLAQLMFKMVGVVIFIFWIPSFADFIEWLSPKSGNADMASALSDNVPRQIANAHTVFNILIVLMFLPLTDAFAKMVHKMLPEKTGSDDEFKVKFLDNQILTTPTLALNLAKQEVVRMANITQDMVNDILLVFFLKDKKVLAEIMKKEEQVNFLRENINAYLLKISRRYIQEEQAQEAFQIMYTVKEIEQIADIVSTNLKKQADEWIASNAEFSDAGKTEITEYHLKTQKQISRAIEVFRDLNLEKARNMKTKFKKYSDMAHQYEKHHYERLFDNVDKSLGSSKIHLEILGMLKAMASHATNIARIHLEWDKSLNKEL
ncbi:MAG: hypothetical protein A2W91_14330 [Bacteroidetes bacterium GWF2_38_335]|nr:MAG: hypothetical protein A2W91_14330 [Bacteroidetes bacterium GWF2_38_335]OFY79363.1 MAG: hypothetical protein A2281_16825 [Bacteroidetes bacterium RIFOXYA12_FULL_38_20]HBS85623.1 hypothetical protein [Bacteroidales bacterium]